MGFSDGAVRFKTDLTIQYAERKLGRQLDPDESQALAYHMYKLEQTKSYYAAAGATAGTWRWYSTMAKMRYPFYQPKLENIDPNKFAFIRGPMAQFARHTWRFSLYALVAGQVGNVIGQFIAQPIAAMNVSRDPKLEQFAIELKAAGEADNQRNAQQGRDIENRRREFQEQVRNREAAGPSPQARWGRQAPRQSEDAGDDMSPTAGNESWESKSASSESWEGFSNNTPAPPPQRQQSRPLPPRQSTPSSSLPFDDDDASPTGGLFSDEVNKPQAQARPGESTWDRLRRGGPPAPLQRPQQPSHRTEPERKEQKEGSTLGDSYTFVEDDEERKRERERAQQEFDARLERERQGKDFSSDEGKRW